MAVWNHSAHRFDRVQEAAYSLVKACARRQVVKGPHKGLWPRPCRSSQSDWQVGLTPELVNHELIFRQISPLAEPRNSVYDAIVIRKKRVHTNAKFE